MKCNKLLLPVLAMLLLLPMLLVSASAEEALGFAAIPSATTVDVGETVEVTLSLTGYTAEASAEDAIRGLQADITNVTADLLEVVEYSSLIAEEDVLSNTASFQPDKGLVRLLYADMDGTLPGPCDQVLKVVFRAKTKLGELGSITLPVTMKIQTQTRQITLTDALVITCRETSGIRIEPGDLHQLVAGKRQQLTAYDTTTDKKLTVSWYLGEGDGDYASLTSSGSLTAKTVTQTQQITVYARASSGAEVSKTIQILPKAANVTIFRDGDALDPAIAVDLSSMDTLQLTAAVTPGDALQQVTWSSSSRAVATVDEQGLVTLLKPGTTTITATAADGSKASAKVKLTVYYVDTAGKLTLTADAPSIGLQPDQSAALTVAGTKTLDNALLEFTTSDPDIARVENGVVFSGDKTGTVTITASLTGDPLNRKATVKIKVIALQTAELILTPQVAEENRGDHNGQPLVILDAGAVSSGSEIFRVSAQALDYAGTECAVGITWASSNTAIATVRDDGDGYATVTVKKGASGDCAITATSKDLAKVSSRLWLSARDYQPRIGKTSLSLELYESASLEVALEESYGNAITGYDLYEGDASSQHFAAEYQAGILTLTALEDTARGTYTETLKVICENGAEYTYTLKIKVTETAPAITVRQTGKPNLFYRETSATLDISAKAAPVAGITVVDGDFTASFEDGVLTLYANCRNPDEKVVLVIRLEGYARPVEKTITLATVTTAPKLKLSAASSIVNTTSKNRSTSFHVLNGTEVLTLEEGDITCAASFADWSLSADEITLTLTGSEGGTATLQIQKEGWAEPVKLTHKVTVQTANPTLKLSATTLQLNRIFPEREARATVSLSQVNQTLADVVITPETSGAEKLDVTWDSADGITARILDSTVEAGTYTYTCVGKLENGDSLKAVTLKIRVSATSPTVKLEATTFKLNRYLAGEETISTGAIISTGYQLVGFAGNGDLPLSYEDGKLTVWLESSDDTGGSRTIYPIVIPDGCEERVTLPKGITVKINTYNSTALSATVSAKGKLDTLDPDSAVICTVKLKNCAGPVSGVYLSGQHGDLFEAEVLEGKVYIKLADGQKYATNKTYKVTLNLTACGKTLPGRDLSIQVSQSILKVKADSTSTIFYQALGKIETHLAVTGPATAEIAQIKLSTRTPAVFRSAVGDNQVCFDQVTGQLTLSLENPGLLTPGRSYTIYLEITPKNNATNAKPAQLKLTVKVQS